MLEESIIIISIIGLVAFACQWLAWRVKLPAILFLLAAGVVLGPTAGVVDPDALFGDLLFPLISLCVAIILFEGSLTLNLSEIKAQQSIVQKLIIVGAAITWVVVAVATHYLFDMSWELSVLFGALTIVTGPTVIVPMLRTVRPNSAISNILRWEGILIDPIGALLVVVVYEFIVTQTQGAGLAHGLLAFVEIIGVGSVLGFIGGWVLAFLLKKHWVPEYLLNLATLSLVFLVFSFSNHFAHESGLLAVTIMGMWLANQKDIHIQEILNFKENLTVVLISGLFILLAARLTFDEILEFGWTPIALLVVIQLIARPLSVFASTYGSSLRWQERALLAWIAPRGIVAAAVSALFAIRLTEAGEAQAAALVPLTFIVIVGTVVIQSATSRLFATWLGVAEPAPKGFLIVGANAVARAVAKELKAKGFRVLLTDSSWENISAARMEGLETFYGNPVSEYADQKLDLVGIGKLLALSPRRALNVVAGMRYKAEFGQQNIYTLMSREDANVSDKHKLGAEEERGYILFDRDLTFSKFASLLSKGAEIRTTTLSEEFSFEEYKKVNGPDVVPLFALSPKGKLQVFVDGGNFQPPSGWKIVSLDGQAEEKRIAAAEEEVAAT